jgi:hypothetical protein
VDRSPPAPDLTAAQQLVCARLDAEGTFPSALGNGSVFLYRTRASGTDRWLVSPAGRVVDFDFLQADRADVAA